MFRIERIAEDINKIADKEVFFNINEIMELDDNTSTQIVGKLLSWACQPQSTTYILYARNCLTGFPKDWVIPKIKNTVFSYIDVTDYWDYLRFLELSDEISEELLFWAIKINENSSDPDILDDISCFEDKLNKNQ